LSVILIWQVPAATEVTVNVALGPVPAGGENVAIPAHDEGAPLVAVSGPA